MLILFYFKNVWNQQKTPECFKSVSIKDLRPINEENYIIYDNDDEIIQKRDTFEDIMLTQNRLKKKSRRNLLLKLKKDYTYNSSAIHYNIKREYMNSDINSNSEFLSNVNDDSKSSSDVDKISEENLMNHLKEKNNKAFRKSMKKSN